MKVDLEWRWAWDEGPILGIVLGYERSGQKGWFGIGLGFCGLIVTAERVTPLVAR